MEKRVALLAQRIDRLEKEVADLKAQVEARIEPAKDGWKRIYGSFANDPAFEEAMRLGRRWRESFDRKVRRKRRQTSVSAAKQTTRARKT